MTKRRLIIFAALVLAFVGGSYSDEVNLCTAASDGLKQVQALARRALGVE